MVKLFFQHLNFDQCCESLGKQTQHYLYGYLQSMFELYPSVGVGEAVPTNAQSKHIFKSTTTTQHISFPCT